MSDFSAGQLVGQHQQKWRVAQQVAAAAARPKHRFQLNSYKEAVCADIRCDQIRTKNSDAKQDKVKTQIKTSFTASVVYITKSNELYRGAYKNSSIKSKLVLTSSSDELYTLNR